MFATNLNELTMLSLIISTNFRNCIECLNRINGLNTRCGSGVNHGLHDISTSMAICSFIRYRWWTYVKRFKVQSKITNGWNDMNNLTRTTTVFIWWYCHIIISSSRKVKMSKLNLQESHLAIVYLHWVRSLRADGKPGFLM